MFGLGWVFAIDFGESTATRASPARDTIDVLSCLLSHSPTRRFIRVSAGPFKNGRGRDLANESRAIPPQARDYPVLSLGNSFAMNPAGLVNGRAVTTR